MHTKNNLKLLANRAPFASFAPFATASTLKLATAVALAAVLVGCSSPVKLDDTPVETRTPTAVTGGSGAGGAAGGNSAGAAQSPVATVDLSRNAQDAAAGANLGRTVYFDFDSFVVKDDYRGLLEGHARRLAADKARQLVVEGHTDARGGREYNLALGQKRAEAVAKSLELLGVGERQIEAVSFGKERPIDPGQDDTAYAKNRRAELKDR